MAPLSTLITDEAYRDHAAFWTSVLDTVSDDFHFRQPWLSYPDEAGTAISEHLALPAATSQLLRDIGGGQDLGVFVGFVSAVTCLLHTYTGAALIPVDSPPLGPQGDDGALDDAIPLIIRVERTASIREHLRRTGDSIAKSYTFQRFPIAQVCDVLLGKPRPRTNIIVSYQGLHDANHGSTSYDLGLTLVRGRELTIRLDGRTPAFSPAYLRNFARHLGNVLGAYADLSLPLNRIDVMGSEERRRILVGYNETPDGSAPDQTVPEVFQDRVREAPGHAAIRLAGETMTYDALNRAANRLARFLQHEYGIAPGDVVGVVSHRSALTIAGLLAVLKAGAVYLPLDSEYPDERLQFMVSDARVKALLVHSEHFPRLAPLYETPMFALDLQLATLEGPDEDCEARSAAGDPAYIIYTSGSTGQPKAVLLEHCGFVNMVAHHIGAFGIDASDRLLQFYGHSFDSSLFEIFVSLLSGATLVMVGRETINDPEQLSAYIKEQQVTTLTLPPIYQSTLNRAHLSSVRRFISAGDNCRVDDAVSFAGAAAYYNWYGPTETSVCVTHYQVDPARRYGSRIPIGTPIAGTAIYLLDDQLLPVPEGVVGEISVGGISLARGYLNRDDLTAEKFVPNPFGTSDRLYRTGDLGVWLPDGNLELIGRKDNQVKIRGYRIEPGEIEAVLAQHPRIRESAVLAAEDGLGHKRLVAYVTGDGEVDVADVKTFLRSRLPEFMIPAAFVVLDAMPLTANGKIDRKALPSPADAGASKDGASEQPQNDTQDILARIWREVLGLERVGIRDNFFELGGDSILVIQIVSRARQAGLRLVPNQLFEHQTIAALSEVATAAGPLAVDEEPLDGPAPLAPMQEWFFAQRFADPHHFNQSVMFEVSDDFQPAAAERAMRTLLEHHDALRLQFVEQHGRWTAVHAPVPVATPFAIVDLSTLTPAERESRLAEAASAEQAAFDLATGPLIRVVLFRLGRGTPARLLFIVHHLVVDGVSWRILLEDFRSLYGQASRAEELTLPPATTSYRTWARRLRQRGSVVADERAYWTDRGRRDVEPLPIDSANGADANTVASARDITRVLDAATTSALLHDTPRAYTTEVNDLLLTALAHTMAAWSGHDRLLVDVEGHGREEILDDLDTSRTVGWFTSQFPLLLHVDRRAGLGDALKSTKERIRAIPRRGAGFGILRHLTDDVHLLEELEALPPAGVLFNYMGQSGRSSSADLQWNPIFGETGHEVSPRAIRRHLIELNGIVLEGRLTLTWTFSEALHRRATIEALATHYEDTLRALIDHCRTTATTQFTPSDFPAARLDQKSLDALIAKLSNP